MLRSWGNRITNAQQQIIQMMINEQKVDCVFSRPCIGKPNVIRSLSQLVEDILSTAERFQDECHALTKEIIEQKPKCTVQDATNVWMFKKLAEFEVRLRQIEFVVQP